jgi:hypothetical protein
VQKNGPVVITVFGDLADNDYAAYCLGLPLNFGVCITSRPLPNGKGGWFAVDCSARKLRKV